MVRIQCPVCGSSVVTDAIPSRLPVEVPTHVGTHGGPCLGAGRRSRDAWMVRPERPTAT